MVVICRTPILPEIVDKITAAIKMFTVSEFSMFFFLSLFLLFAACGSLRLAAFRFSFFEWFVAVVEFDLDCFWPLPLTYMYCFTLHYSTQHSGFHRTKQNVLFRFVALFSFAAFLLCPICSTKLNTITFSITHFYWVLFVLFVFDSTK